MYIKWEVFTMEEILLKTLIDNFKKCGAILIRKIEITYDSIKLLVIAPKDFVERLCKYFPETYLGTSLQYKDSNNMILKSLPKKLRRRWVMSIFSIRKLQGGLYGKKH